MTGTQCIQIFISDIELLYFPTISHTDCQQSIPSEEEEFNR